MTAMLGDTAHHAILRLPARAARVPRSMSSNNATSFSLSRFTTRTRPLACDRCYTGAVL